MVSPYRLCILAGAGDLPFRVYEGAQEDSRYRGQSIVLAIRGVTNPSWLGVGVPHRWTKLIGLVGALEGLREEGVSSLVMAGALKRPSLASFLGKVDRRTLSVAKRVLSGAYGDDAVLRRAIEVMEEAGYEVLGVEDVMGKSFASLGVWGTEVADAQALADVKRGIEVVLALGVLDVGQSVIVQQGMVLGVEAIEGTHALIERCKGLHREGVGGVLVKLQKPKQERRADLPVIGVHTVRACGACGLRGMAVEAGSVLVIDRESVIAEANRRHLFVMGVDA
ncbi:MAG: UDP-2,3-diacylglucosamine diphosphatase LpxI [Alphaproteobacteria bacterium GM7ARS4]|nr:UDP-2,3-diacylglucosamine diphosphatase LpxI [Alphaproteobacteria bacterium GM7ARS4]